MPYEFFRAAFFMLNTADLNNKKVQILWRNLGINLLLWVKVFVGLGGLFWKFMSQK